MQTGEDGRSNKSDVAIGNKLTASFSEAGERKIIWLLCTFAAIHVFIFSAAFPFFNNVDETEHFDLVLQYSHGQVPRHMTNDSREASVYLALFCSSAYFGPTAGPIPPPPWTQPPEKMRRDLEFNSRGWQLEQNYENSEPPLYYFLAGSWWHIGKWLGFDGGRLLYWLHFLNVLFIVVLVWLGYVAARVVFPGNPFLKLGVPALLAFMPQTAFYSIGNDILSAICFGIVFICLLKWFATENPPALLGAATGLAFAATLLTKMTNLPLLAVAVVGLLIQTWPFTRDGKVKTRLPALASFFGCAVPPIAGWMLWCKYNYGDFTGSKIKTEHFGWTLKPIGEWWHHPIFSPGGFWTYISGQLTTFWQGEFMWYHPPTARPLALPGSDIIYPILSLGLIALALPGLFPRGNPSPLQRQALQLSLACFCAAVAFFGCMSIAYDFHNCVNPSRAHPYFHAGRMFLGALIPFLLLFVYGLHRGLKRFGATVEWTVLTVMVLAMLVTEIVTDWQVFSNDYNWFHLP
jgi:hypothetical protein